MRIVVTGAGGQLGSELCRGWAPDCEIIGLDLPGFDLTDRDAVVERLCGIGPQAVVNTAAYTQVDRAEEEPDLCRAVNARGVAYLVEACRRLDAVLVQVSTDYVFGREEGRRVPYRETDEPGPLGEYGRAKLEGERSAAQGARHIIVRTSGLYGRPGPHSPGNFPQTILRLAREGRPLRVVDDQHVCPSYAPHVARAIRFLLQAAKVSGVYHVVNRGQTTWYGFAAELLRLAGLETDLEPVTTADYYKDARRRKPQTKFAPRPEYSVLDPGKFLALEGRPEMPAWQEALAEYVALEAG